MKLRHLLTGTILTVTFLAATAFTAFAAVSKGRFETADDTAITGWAYNSDAFDKALTVQISIKKESTGEEVLSRRLCANEYREDLYRESKGNGCHGFTLNVDWSSYDEGVYLIEGTVDGRSFSNTRTYTNGTAAEAAEEETAQPSNANLVSLGVFKTTAYCPCYACSEGWGRHTCTGAIAQASHTVAVDPRVIPYGSKLMINGVIYTAEDKGGGVRGNHIDIFYDTHAETRQHGTRNAEVYLVQL